MPVLVILGIVDLIDDVRLVRAFAAHPVRIALRPDREHDIFRCVDIALSGLDRKVALLARHFDDIGVIGDAHLVVRGILVPIAKDIFARPLGKAAVGAEVEPFGRREHALALLIFKDGVGEVIGLFEQDMAHPELPGARESIEIPDYQPTLANTEKILLALTQRVDVIAKSPAMKLTPETMGERVNASVASATGELHNLVNSTRSDMSEAAREIGRAHV